MPRPCNVCQHPQQKAIDLALVAGKPANFVSQSFGVSVYAVQRHRVGHLRPAARRALATREDISAHAVLDRMAQLQTKTLALLDKAMSDDCKPSEVARVVRECRENELALARLTGQLREGATVINDHRKQLLILESMSEQQQRAIAQLAEGLPASLDR